MPISLRQFRIFLLVLMAVCSGCLALMACVTEPLAQTISVPSETAEGASDFGSDIPDDLFVTDTDDFSTARTLLHGMLLGLLLGLAAFHLARFLYAEIRISLATFALLLSGFLFEYTVFGYHEAFTGDDSNLSMMVQVASAGILAVVGFHFLRRFLDLGETHSNYDVLLRVLFFGSLFALAVTPFNVMVAKLMITLALFIGIVGVSVLVAFLSRGGSTRAQICSPGVFLLTLAFLGQGLLQAFALETSEALSVLVHLLFVIGLLLLSYAVLSERDVRDIETALPALPAPARHGLTGPSYSALDAATREDDHMHGRLALALAASGEGVWDWDFQEQHLFLSTEAEHLLGIEPGTFDGTRERWLSLLAGDDVSLFREFMLSAAGGHEASFTKSFRPKQPVRSDQVLELQASVLTGENGAPQRCVGMLRDISDRTAQDHRPIDAGEIDILTNVLTRSAFMTRLEEQLTSGDVSEDQLSELFVIDLDRFKVVNEGIGHAAGDQLLAGVAERLTAFSGESDQVGRLAGDEFALLLNRQGGNANAEGIADLILDLLSRPFEIGNREVFLGASIGFVALGNSENTAGEILQNAEFAAQEAKRAGGGQWREFAPVMRGAADESVSLHAELSRALERDEIELHFQPIFALADKRIAGFEALLRWRHPKRGILGADQFIPVAEETGLIVELGRFALSLASVQLYQWQAFFPLDTPLFVSVNMSSRELLRPDLVTEFEEVIHAVTVAPGTLKVELTESQVLHDEDSASDVIERLREMGAGLALDDFGTGYQALSRLKKYRFNTLKVDRSFVSAMDTEEEAPVITKTIVDLAHELGMDVIAEGVETDAHVEMLLQMGCDFGQGFHFGAAMTAEDAQKFIALHWAN